MRVHHVEKGLGNFREVVVQAQVDAGGQQGDRFNEALDVRVFAAVGLQLEPRRHLRILGGELSAHLAEEGQLAFVVTQQFIAHGRRPQSHILR